MVRDTAFARERIPYTVICSLTLCDTIYCPTPYILPPWVGSFGGVSSVPSKNLHMEFEGSKKLWFFLLVLFSLPFKVCLLCRGCKVLVTTLQQVMEGQELFGDRDDITSVRGGEVPGGSPKGCQTGDGGPRRWVREAGGTGLGKKTRETSTVPGRSGAVEGTAAFS